MPCASDATACAPSRSSRAGGTRGTHPGGQREHRPRTGTPPPARTAAVSRQPRPSAPPADGLDGAQRSQHHPVRPRAAVRAAVSRQPRPSPGHLMSSAERKAVPTPPGPGMGAARKGHEAPGPQAARHQPTPQAAGRPPPQASARTAAVSSGRQQRPRPRPTDPQRSLSGPYEAVRRPDGATGPGPRTGARGARSAGCQAPTDAPGRRPQPGHTRRPPPRTQRTAAVSSGQVPRRPMADGATAVRTEQKAARPRPRPGHGRSPHRSRQPRPSPAQMPPSPQAGAWAGKPRRHPRGSPATGEPAPRAHPRGNRQPRPADALSEASAVLAERKAPRPRPRPGPGAARTAAEPPAG